MPTGMFRLRRRLQLPTRSEQRLSLCARSKLGGTPRAAPLAQLPQRRGSQYRAHDTACHRDYHSRATSTRHGYRCASGLSQMHKRHGRLPSRAVPALRHLTGRHFTGRYIDLVIDQTAKPYDLVVVELVGLTAAAVAAAAAIRRLRGPLERYD
jgi:hypothetical protein